MSEKYPLISIIIINWNSFEFLKKCLSSIHSFPPSFSYEIIVLDNASNDRTALDQYLPQSEPAVIFKPLNKNLGFAKANNIGYNISRGDVLIFLNPDTEITCNAIDELVTVVSSEELKAGCVGARLLNADGSLQTNSIMPLPTIVNVFFDIERLKLLTWKLKFWGVAPMFRRLNHPQEVQAIAGACMCMRREVFEKVQGFSEDYFMYSEDVDICYKITKAGYKNLYIDSAEIIHFGGGATSGNTPSKFSTVLWRESKYTFFKINYGIIYAQFFRMSILINAFLRLICISIFLFPLCLNRNYRYIYSRFIFKWSSILSWAIGNEHWVQEINNKSDP